ncbi:MAG: FAD-dependent oxidoreductase [Pseudomonadota bacterium]
MRIVIIGSGIAGHSACRAVLESSKETEIVLITKEVVPLYSPCVLPHYLAGEISKEKVFLSGEFENGDDRVRLMAGSTVSQINRVQKHLILDHETLSYDQLILALGGYSVIPTLKGIDLPGVFHFKTLADVEKLLRWPGEKTVVVGSGPIGVEVAAALRRRGRAVCLVEFLDQLLPNILDPSPAKIVEAILGEAGIEIILGERVVSLEGKDRVEAVLTDKQTIPADSVVFAIGIRPEVDLAEKGGIKIGPLGGIVTDSFLRTNDPNIWACGDCIESFDVITQLPVLNMLWPNAREQGSIAGLNSTGGTRLYKGSFSFVTVTILNTFIFSMGRTSRSLVGATVKEKESEKGYTRLLIQENRLAGVQIIGDDSLAGMIVPNILNPERLLSLKTHSSRWNFLFPIPYPQNLMALLNNSTL